MSNNHEFDPAAWMKDAACRGADPELFFPGRGKSTNEAKAICAGCSTRQECLDYAMRFGIKHGLWGGLSERQRRKLRADPTSSPLRLITRPGPPQCGTVGGASAHRRRAESVCTECRQAYREWRARQRQLTVVEGGAA